MRFVVGFLISLGLVYHHGCSLTSASHCCELLIFWMDVIESQLIGRCNVVSAGIDQWWGKNKKYIKKKPLRTVLKTNRMAVGPKCYFAGFLECLISFHHNLSVLSVNNWSRYFHVYSEVIQETDSGHAHGNPHSPVTMQFLLYPS